jgi:hypothetical protein
MMKRILLALAILTVVSASLFGIGAFNMFSGRNHGELVWKVLETDHYQIVYHEPLEDCACASAEVCEAAYSAYVQTYGYTPKHKIPVYISDQDEIANGATVFTWYVFVWVNQNDYVTFLTGNRKWLDAVLCHELSHYFMYSTIADWMSGISPINSLQFPRDMSEGYAQFFSGEPWGHNRGDTYLRRAVLAGDVSVDPRYPDWGGVVYARGFSYVRYLELRYGEEKLIKLLTFRNKSKMYNFDEAFKKVYAKSFKEFQEEWRRYIYTYYYGNAYRTTVSEDTLCVGTERNLSTKWNSIDRMVIADSTVVMYGRPDKNQGFGSLVMGVLDADSLKAGKLIIRNQRLIERAGLSNLAMSPNHRYIVWTRYIRGEYGSVVNGAYRYDTTTHQTDFMGHGAQPSVMDDGTVLYQRLTPNGRIVFRNQNGTEAPWITYPVDTQIGHIAVNRTGDRCAVAVFDTSRVFVLQQRSMADGRLLESRAFFSMPLQVMWSEANEPVVMVEDSVDYRRMLWLETAGTWTEYHTPAYNITPIQVAHDANRLELLTFAEIGRVKDDLIQIELWPQNATEAPATDYFNAWTSVRPHHAIVKPDSAITMTDKGRYPAWKNIRHRMTMAYPTNKYIVGTTTWSEPMGRHLLTFAGVMPYHKDDQFYTNFVYQNKCCRPTITLWEYSTRWLAGFDDDDEDYWEKINEISLSVIYPLDWIKAPYWSLNAGGVFNYRYNHLVENKDLETRPYYDDGESYSAGVAGGLAYGLPYTNAFVHPVREFSLSGQWETGLMSFDTDRQFTSGNARVTGAWAPFFAMGLPYPLRMLSVNQDTNYEATSNNNFVQNRPGFDRDSHFIFNGQPFFHRPYLRGHDMDWIGQSLLISSNELRVKVLDKTGVSLNMGSPLISFGYLGASGWFDYARITDAFYESRPMQDAINFRTMGWEARLVTEFAGIPFVNRFGRAYETDGTAGDYYYLLEMSMGI